MTSNSTARRIVSRQSNQEKRVGRLSTVEKSACTDDIIRKRLDTLGNPYVEIGTALINQDNLVVNGDFTYDMTGWSSEVDLVTGFLIPTVDPEHGWLSISAIQLGFMDNITITSAPIEVDATKSYRTSLQWYDTYINEYSGDMQWTAKVVEYDQNDAFVKETTIAPASTPTPWDTWYEKSLDFTPDATTITVRIVLYGIMSSNNISMIATARIDTVSLVRTGNLPEIKVELEKVTVLSDDFQVDGTLTAGNINTTPTANCIPKADGTGKLATGWIPALPHSGLGGLSNDDHPQYLKWASNTGVIKWHGQQYSYRGLLNTSSGNVWTRIALVEIGTGIYQGANFKVEFLDGSDSWGRLIPISDAVYYIRCTRSGSVQDDYNDAEVEGEPTGYCRVVKTATGVYEIQVRGSGTYDHCTVVVQPVSTSSATTITYGQAAGSTTGTIYTATRPAYSTKFYPLTSPLTSTSWDGDARSTTAKTLIDLSAVFGVPAGVKAVLALIQCRDSASSGTATNYFSISPSSSADVHAIITRCSGLPNDYWASEVGVCPCDDNGDIYYQCTASGTSTLDVYLQIWGYWL